MSVPAFADIGKATRELLFGGKAGKFQYDKSVTFKTKANDNVDFTLNSVMKATSVTSELKAAFKLQNGISTEVSLKPDWKAAVSASSTVVPGLKATLGGTVPDPHSGQVKVEYAIDHLSVKASSTLTSKPNLEVAVSSGANGFVVGGEVGYSVEKAAPTKYGAAAGYVGKGFGLALFSADMMRTVKAAYHQELDATSSVAVELAAKPSEVGLGGFVLGFTRQLDSGALAKAKIDQDGLLSLLYETVLEKHLKLALSMQMDALNMDGKKNKFGMALEFS